MAAFRMSWIWGAAGAAFMVLGAVAPATAETISKTVDVGSFTAVHAASGLDVTYAPGAPKVVIEGPAAEVARVEAVVRGGALELGRQHTGIQFRMFARDVHVQVTGPAALEGLKASSGADLDATGLSATSLTLTASSGADVTAAGTCATLVARASSGADIKAGRLICEAVTADASSGADISVHATRKADATASSGADVIVSGPAPIINRSESSGGDVHVRR